VKHDFRKEPIQRKLRELGFSRLEDKELIEQMAVCVRDHEHFRAILAKVEPDKRGIAYEAFRGHLRFTPKPLEVYLSESAQKAEAEKLPVWDEKNQTVTDYADYHGSGRPYLEVLAEQAIHRAERERTAKGSLTLVCRKCTREAIFPSLDHIAAYAYATKVGWIFEKDDDGKERAVCPECPAARVELANA
jgi:hypothetical protein